MITSFTIGMTGTTAPIGYTDSHMVKRPCATHTGFKLNQIERDSIEHHMFPLTPYPPKYIEGYLVTAADKISATKETLSFDRFDKPASGQPTDRS